jgi:hypothetical protein
MPIPEWAEDSNNGRRPLSARPDVARAADYWLSGQGACPGWKQLDPWTEKRHTQIAQYLQSCATAGETDAQYLAGKCFELGFGLENNDCLAVEWYAEGARRGDSRAQNALGRCFEEGIGVETDYTKAAQLYALAAGKGDPEGLDNFARCNERGIGLDPDLVRAQECRRRADAIREAGAAFRDKSGGLSFFMADLRNEEPRAGADGRRWVFRRSGGEVYLSAGDVIVPGGMLRGCGWVRSVIFGSNSQVKMISDYAFYESGIVSIEIPSSVEVVGIASFAHCKSLNDVQFETRSSLKIICEDAFWATAIRAVSIPESVARVDDWSFAWCSRLTNVEFEGHRPNDVSESAFEFTAYEARNAKNVDARRLFWPSGVRRSVSLHNLSEVRALLESSSVSVTTEERDSCGRAMLKADELRRGKRHFDAQKMYLRSIYGFGRSEYSRVLRIVIQRGMEVFGEIPVVGERVIEMFRPIFSAVRNRHMIGDIQDAAWELRRVARRENNPEVRRRVRRYAAFLVLLAAQWERFRELDSDSRGALDILLYDHPEWQDHLMQ